MKKILKLTALSLLTLSLCGCEKTNPSNSGKPTDSNPSGNTSSTVESVDLVSKYQPLLAKGVYKLEESRTVSLDTSNFKLPDSITAGKTDAEIKELEKSALKEMTDYLTDGGDVKIVIAYSEGKYYSSMDGYLAPYKKGADDTDASKKDGDTISYNHELSGKVNVGFLTGDYNSDTGEYEHISFADNYTNPLSSLAKEDLKESDDKKSFTFAKADVATAYLNKFTGADAQMQMEYENILFNEVNNALNLSFSVDYNKVMEKNLDDGQTIDDILYGIQMTVSFTGVYDFSITEAYKDFEDIEEGKNKELDDAFDKLKGAGTYKIHSKITEPDKNDTTKVNVYEKDNIYRNIDSGFDAYASFGKETTDDDGSVSPADNLGIAKFDDGKFRDFDFDIDSNGNITVNPGYVNEYITDDLNEFVPVYDYEDSDARIWEKNSDGTFSLIETLDSYYVEDLYGALLADGEDKEAKYEISSLKLTVENSTLTKLTAEKRSGAKIEYTYTYNVENDFAKFNFTMPKLVSDEYIGYWVLEADATSSDKYAKNGLTLDISIGVEDGEKFLIFNFSSKADGVSYVYTDNEKYNEKENNITFTTTESIATDSGEEEEHTYNWTASISDDKNSITLSYKCEDDETKTGSYTLAKTEKPATDDDADDGD